MSAAMHQPPSHHRAIALLLAIVAVLGIARVSPPRAVTIPAQLRAPTVDAGAPRVDPQTASARALDALPGIGPSIARRIVEARARGAVFERPEDLRRVRGIGPRTVARLAPYLYFTGRRAASRPPSR